MLNSKLKKIPVRIFQKGNQFGLVAPLAGLEPEDITVSIEGRRVTIQGKERGPRQHNMDLVKAEWTIGPYERKIVLPEPVDGPLTNATYGNGVLVLTLPKASTKRPARAQFKLFPISSTRGEYVGHTGHNIRQTTTAERSSHISNHKRPAA